MYVGAQFVGGILGTVGTWIAYGSLAREVALLAATFPRRCRGPQGAFGGDPDRLYPGLRSDLGSHRREGPSGRGPLAVGFALACGVLIAGPVTGGSVNPARTLGRALVAGHFDAVWVYIVGPIAGGVLAALLYYSFIPEAETLIREHGRLPFRKLN